jgi:hypothetical protein
MKCPLKWEEKDSFFVMQMKKKMLLRMNNGKDTRILLYRAILFDYKQKCERF